jgi:Na+-driven multidrug efflux pump
MPVMVVTFLGSALMTPYNSLINGLGYASLSMVIGLLDGVVARISLSLALGAAFGVMGYWYGNAVAGFVTVILAAAYYYSGRWRTRKLLVE